MSSTTELPLLAERWDDLVVACQRGDLATVDRLISEAEAHGMKALEERLEFARPQWRTAMLTVCVIGRIGVVNRLLVAGVDIEADNNKARPAIVSLLSQPLPAATAKAAFSSQLVSF